MYTNRLFILDEPPLTVGRTINAYNWVYDDDNEAEMSTKLSQEAKMALGTRMLVRGDQIKAGDYVDFQTRGEGTEESYNTWGVFAVKAPKPSEYLAWARSRGGKAEVMAETRWNAKYWFIVHRPGPERNEFGEVSP